MCHGAGALFHLIDVGNDAAVIERIRATPTGVGKRPVEQVILTHGHFDHAALLPAIREAFQPVAYAHSEFVKADHILEDGQTLRCGDRMFEVIYTPGHSNDSICLYCQEDGVLFVGDTPVIIRSTDGSHEEDFVRALERLCEKNVKVIYFGHGDPLRTIALLAEKRREEPGTAVGQSALPSLLEGDRQQHGFDNPL